MIIDMIKVFEEERKVNDSIRKEMSLEHYDAEVFEVDFKTKEIIIHSYIDCRYGYPKRITKNFNEGITTVVMEVA